MQKKHNKTAIQWMAAIRLIHVFWLEAAQNDDEQNVQYQDHSYGISMAAMAMFMMNMTHDYSPLG